VFSRLNRFRRGGIITRVFTRVFTRVRVVIRDCLSATILADAEATDHAFGCCAISLRLVTDLEVLDAARVVPVGKDDSHATLKRVVQFHEIVAAIIF